jgi:hypothetical protein
MKLAIALVLASAALAQPAPQITLTGPATVRPGEAVTVSVSLAGTSAAYAFGWTMAKPAGVTMAATAGAASIAAQKTVIEGPTGKLIGYGINANPIQPGELAKYTFTVPATAVGGSTLTFSVTEALGATLTGTAIPVAAVAPLAVRVLKSQDANGDGKVDGVDVLITAHQVVGLAACDARGDVNKDSKCDLIDTQIVVNAALEEEPQ